MKLKLSTTGYQLRWKYSNFSPMTRMIFGSVAESRYAQDKSLKPVIKDLTTADQLARSLLYSYLNAAQASHQVRTTLTNNPRPRTVLNYSTDLMVLGDDIVFRMSYLYGKTYSDMSQFQMQHPFFSDKETLNKQMTLLSRPDLKSFTMREPQYNQFYYQWVASSRDGKCFSEKLDAYVPALKEAHQELSNQWSRLVIPQKQVDMSFIYKIYRTRT